MFSAAHHVQPTFSDQHQTIIEQLQGVTAVQWMHCRQPAWFAWQSHSTMLELWQLICFSRSCRKVQEPIIKYQLTLTVRPTDCAVQFGVAHRTDAPPFVEPLDLMEQEGLL